MAYANSLLRQTFRPNLHNGGVKNRRIKSQVNIRMSPTTFNSIQ
jgi:hypothetical protein